ncbi:hypothetical protein [Brevibacillus invocatus]|uniref:hypothetical protein n=1 Tax=Brevibacillus invocatus TaxID=173959 RepID=UPI00203AD3A4|nr:hypothetical protein [Brevibacillus invocatus]MCM3077850.1 hypothetical protein [Brevibacillus invocatus]MCM3428076.1 hypothetical protein [Brevibacillus invocatus]
MYIRPKLLWWGLPAFLVLFLVGIALGMAGDRNDVEESSLVSHQTVDRRIEEQIALTALLDQLTEQKERSFIVYMKESALNGSYEQDRFRLEGEIGGHKLEIKRDDQQQVTVQIDGQMQDHAALPYALYTPHEHAELLKGVMQSLETTPVQDTSGQGWRGFHISVPSQEVTSLLDMWLGPSFPIKELSPELAKQIAVDYELWYDEKTGLVRQLEIQLLLKTSAGEKRDQLRFQL